MDSPVEQEVIGLLFGGTVAMLLLALALVAFFLLYQKKLVSQQLRLQTLQYAYQKELLSATIQAEERERERIGNDLHDEIGSALSAAKILIAQLAYSPTASPRELEVVSTVEGLLGDSLRDIRNISQNLHPAVLAQFGLDKALYNLSSRCTDSFAQGMQVQVELTSTLSTSQELAVYRIVQEAVNNAMKHAQASRLTVLLQEQQTGLSLTIADDGCGFDYALAQQNDQGGLGLKSLAARASLLDAALHIESEPGRGTRLHMAIPLSSVPAAG